jgi:hypothetical protein
MHKNRKQLLRGDRVPRVKESNKPNAAILVLRELDEGG